jgi:pimeloyl-ACP methyl ester carboxylesterase
MPTLIAAILALALALAPAAGAAKTGPAGDSFYEPPSKLPKGHGKLIWKRASGSYVRLDNAAYTKNVLYTSKSPQRERIAVSGSISVPEGKAPKGGWPVISYAHGTTGVADVCAPSKASAKNPALAYTDDVYPQLEEWLAAGYAVLRTDYPGLGTPGPHPYLIGKSEARGVLDIIRAARDFDPSIGRRFVIAGHSQGGHAALFAAAYAAGWTPELKLRGTVSYAPASHLLEQGIAIGSLSSPSPLSGLATAILYGATTANPGVVAEQALRPGPYSLYPLLEQKCAQQVGQSHNYGQFAPADLLAPGQPDATFSKVLAKMNPDVETGQPVLLAQGSADTTVFQVFTDQLNGELVAGGNDIDYRVYPGVGHGDIVAAAEPEVLPWIEQRLSPTG